MRPGISFWRRVEREAIWDRDSKTDLSDLDFLAAEGGKGDVWKERVGVCLLGQ